MNPTADADLGPKELRSFGLTTGGVVGVLFGVVIPWIWDLNYPLWPWIVLGVLWGWALVAPTTMKGLYRGWMKIGLMISKVTTPIILGVVFFLVVMPVGVVMRIVRRDPMERKFDANMHSYRVKRPDSEKSTLENPY